MLCTYGTRGGQAGKFLVPFGETAHQKHRLQTGTDPSRFAVPIEGPRKETAALYRTRAAKVVNRAEAVPASAPLSYCVPTAVKIHRGRRHLRLSDRTYDARCKTCIWGSRTPAETIVDKRNSDEKRYRFETCCQGQRAEPSTDPARNAWAPTKRGWCMWRRIG